MPPIVLFICDSPQLRCAWRPGAARRPRFSFELVEIAETGRWLPSSSWRTCNARTLRGFDVLCGRRTQCIRQRGAAAGWVGVGLGSLSLILLLRSRLPPRKSGCMPVMILIVSGENRWLSPSPVRHSHRRCMRRTNRYWMCSRSAEPLSRVRSPGFPAPVRRGQRRDASLRYRLVCTTVTTVRLNARNGIGTKRKTQKRNGAVASVDGVAVFILMNGC